MIRPVLLSIALLLLAACLGIASAASAGKDAATPYMKKIDLGIDPENPFSDAIMEINPADARALRGAEKIDEEEEDADVLDEMIYRRERMLKKFSVKVKNCRSQHESGIVAWRLFGRDRSHVLQHAAEFIHLGMASLGVSSPRRRPIMLRDLIFPVNIFSSLSFIISDFPVSVTRTFVLHVGNEEGREQEVPMQRLDRLQV